MGSSVGRLLDVRQAEARQRAAAHGGLGRRERGLARGGVRKKKAALKKKRRVVILGK